MQAKKITKVIVEGPDCSGKDTLVERIKNRLRWDSRALHHFECADQFERYAREYLFCQNTVFNRSHFSEDVYSIMWRGGSPFDNKERECLDYLSQRDAIVILACPSVESLKQRYSSRKYAQQIKLDELERCRERFVERFEGVECWTYKSDSWEELEGMVSRVVTAVSGRNL